MRANVAAEAVGRTLATRLLEMTDDPGMKDLLKFLIARDTMHQQQWLAVLEELGPRWRPTRPATTRTSRTTSSTPTRSSTTWRGATWTRRRAGAAARRSTARDLLVADPAPPLGAAPDLQPAPTEVHAGADATGPGASVFNQVAKSVGGVVDKVKPG
jgi:Mn-containing catalase